MELIFPEGYHVPTMETDERISINGRHFTRDEFVALVTPRPTETVTDHARRLASVLGIGLVISWRAGG